MKRKYDFLTVKRALPDGRRLTLEMVKHPGATLIVPFIEEGKVILLRQFRAVIQTFLYELPAGTLNHGEKMLECAHRELIEETGFAAKKWKRLGKIYPCPGYSDEIITIYKAEQLSRRSGIPDPDEIIEVKILNKGQVKSLWKRGLIEDAKTICGLALCGWL